MPAFVLYTWTDGLNDHPHIIGPFPTGTDADTFALRTRTVHERHNAHFQVIDEHRCDYTPEQWLAEFGQATHE